MNSKLQIISGKYGGRKLALPVAARPTQNKARIALFNMLDEVLGANMRSQTVWDAFAGSGEFGIEFLSRDWANDVIFTDIDSDAIKTINKNLVGIARNPIIRQIDATVAADKFGAAADVIFID
ncbi:MAG: RsmD family RNA methyltransferase, partial [Alphaproteobacteria bacterium]|nr:RsmD family RNA methyltransferase [Alphaproteobacteria bacterium]